MFSKDAKFKPTVAEKQAAPAPAKDPKPMSNLSEVKIGEIKLRGKVQLPTRKVILDETQLGDMRRNLALFSC